MRRIEQTGSIIVLTAEQYLSEKETLAKKQEELKEQICRCEEQMEAERKQQSEDQGRHTSVSHMATLTDEMLKAHLYDAVERIIVHDGESIEIVWKFDERKILA